MANEYRATTLAAEVFQTDAANTDAKVTTVGLEAYQTDDDNTDTKVTAVGLEVAQTDDDNTDLKVALVALEVWHSLTNGSTQDISFTGFGGDLSLGIDLQDFPGLNLNFRGVLTLGFSPVKFPTFECPAPPIKTWARHTVAAKAWACATVVPAEECDGADDTTFDWLGTVDGSDFASVSDYQIKAA